MNGFDQTRETARRIAGDYVARGDNTGWFEPLYALAQNDPSIVPWADLAPSPLLVAWLDASDLARDGEALVVGCGLGDDAAELAGRGWKVTAFDISPTAVAASCRRFARSGVSFQVADVLNPPKDWLDRFHLVVEVYTLQVLPDPSLRQAALARLAACLAPAGTLLVIARGRDSADDPGRMPWPLRRTELEDVEPYGLRVQSFEDFLDAENPPVRRFRVVYRRVAPSAATDLSTLHGGRTSQAT